MNLCLDLLKNGYVVQEANHLIGIVDTTTMSFVQTNHDRKESYPDIDPNLLTQRLSTIHYQIALEFIEPYAESYTLTKAALWEGSLSRHKTWHSDVLEADDMFFLLYFTDHTETNDGAIIIRNTLGEHRYVPRPGLMIGIENTNPEFAHMVEPAVGKRIVGAFGFKVEWKHDLLK
jgi:hypothetical protein